MLPFHGPDQHAGQLCTDFSLSDPLGALVRSSFSILKMRDPDGTQIPRM
jgi:hypothetical protein